MHVVRQPLGQSRALPPGPTVTDDDAPNPLRILVIDDNEDIAESLCEIVGHFGHEAAMSFTGEEGLLMAQSFRPHVVICDIGLPTMDGYGVAQALRANSPLSGLLLVASSGYERPEVIARASAAGFDRFLAKPVRLAQITELLADIPARCQTSDHGP